ncbi:MAG: hypothetical protein AAF512_21475 [Pseudomonadota bacterium]
MKIHRIITWLCLTSLFGVAHIGFAQTEDSRTSFLQRPAVSILKFRGKVVHMPMEGGFYGIVSDRNKKYLPQSLPEAFQKEGMRVKVEVIVETGRITLQMWGKPVKIVKITPEQSG